MTQKDKFELLMSMIHTGEKEQIEAAFEKAEELGFDLMKKLKPWEKILEGITVEKLAAFFSVKKLAFIAGNKLDRNMIKSIRLFTQIEELFIETILRLNTGEQTPWMKIPKGLAKLTNLKKITIDHLDEKIMLPAEVAQFPKLKELIIDEVEINAEWDDDGVFSTLEVFAGLGERLTIKKLHLSSGHLSGVPVESGFEWLGKLKNVEELYLAGGVDQLSKKSVSSLESFLVST